jgi:hypothetical protein
MSTHSKVEVFSLAFGRRGLVDGGTRARRLAKRFQPCPLQGAFAAGGGALGGTLVSGALWGPWWQVPAWIVVLVATATIFVPPTLALSGQPLGFMAGWSLFWGLLIGAVAMWGAQLNGAGWAYGVAGVIGFFVGITHGIYEPEDLRGHDGFFAISMIAAPTGACLAAWLYRHGLLGQSGLASAALAGVLAGLILLGPSMLIDGLC